MPIRAPVVERSVVSSDGTRIVYYRVGRGPRRWLMPPAMGAPLISMKHVLDRFADEFTIVSWDMRGFYRSGAASGHAGYAVDRHLDDMIAVRDAEGLSGFVLGGWSMGVQLSLEYVHRFPDDVRALVLIHGPYESALSSTGIPGAERLVAPLLALAERAGWLINALASRLFGLPGLARLLERAGLLAANPEFFEEILAEFRHVDWGRYFAVMSQLHAHSAARYLAAIRVPTLITAGGHDFLTPVAVAERMHRAISGSELFVVPRGTHYTPAEFPDELNARISQFLARLD